MTEQSPLHPIEKAILNSLSTSGENLVSLDELTKKSSLSIDQLRRGIEWLKAKGLIRSEEKEVTSFSLGAEGQSAAKLGLPERKLVNLIRNSGGFVDLSHGCKNTRGRICNRVGEIKEERLGESGW